MDFQGSRKDWEAHLTLIEFAYNNSVHSSIEMPPYEALYGRKCRTPVCWYEVGERRLTGAELVDQATDVIRQIRTNMKAAQDRQKEYEDKRRRPVVISVGDQVFVKEEGKTPIRSSREAYTEIHRPFSCEGSNR